MPEAIELLKKTVQEDDLAYPGGISGAWFQQIDHSGIFDDLPPWGNPSRQWALRRLYYRAGNSMVASAIQQLIRQVKQTPTEIVGEHPNLTHRFQELFQQADLGGGIDQLLSKLLTDYYTLDIGGVLELVGPGDHDTPLTRPVEGLVALDALRCYMSGNLEFPIYYRSHRTNKLHKMHWTRVVRLVDMPSPDPFYRGLGYCALSRAAAVAQAEIALYRLEMQNLSEEPANGIIVFAGLAQEKVLTKLREYTDNKKNDVPSVLRNLIQITSTEPGTAVDVKLVPFSQLPVGYKYEDVVQNHVNLLALAIGVDPQDIWPLSGSAMGSGSQSKILHIKDQGKALGDTISLLGRTWNIMVLPRSLELRYKPRDTEREQSDANIASTWATMVEGLVEAGLMSIEQGDRLLANNVEAFNDVLLDESGALRLPTGDAKEPNEAGVPKLVPKQPERGSGGNLISAPDSSPNTRPSDRRSAVKEIYEEARKSAEGVMLTQLDFEDRFWDIIQEATRRHISEAWFNIRVRSLIMEYGDRAFHDGLDEAGVNRWDISKEDRATITGLVVEKAVYVDRVARAIFSSRSTTESLAAEKPPLWWSNVILSFYLAGLKSGEENGVYVWQADNKSGHSADCVRLAAGHKHRLEEWVDSGLLAKKTCGCQLVRSSGPTVGSFSYV